MEEQQPDWKKKREKFKAVQAISQEEAIERAQRPKGEAMPKGEAGDKGRDVLQLMAELYQLIEWEQDEQDGDPYLKMVFYKSGKSTIKTYNVNDVSVIDNKESKKK
mgnify:CR=1 FL=1